MVRIAFWLQFLLLVLILGQSGADSDECRDWQNEIPCLEGHRLKIITELEFRNEILSLKNQLEAEGKFLKYNNEIQNRMQTTIDDLIKKEEANERTVQQLREDQKQLQTTIDGLTLRDEANNLAVQELSEKQKQLQATIDGLKQIVEELSQTVKGLCGQPKDACRYLLEAIKSVDVNSVRRWVSCTDESCTTDDQYRYTPLIYATVMGRVEVVRVLLEGGANVDRINPYRRTALHFAAWFGQLNICHLLVDWGAKVDPLDIRKNSPLHDAARLGYLSVVKLLVERGADVRLKNVDGLTASDFARSWGRIAVAEWLDLVSGR